MMKLVAVMPARNEEWIIGLSLRAALMWCDQVIVGLHCCEDRTEEIVRGIAAETRRVSVVRFVKPDWNEMDYRQVLLQAARESHATHVAIIDADEVLTGDLLPVMRDRVSELRPGDCVTVPGLALWDGLDHYRVDHLFRSWYSLAFRDSPKLHWRDRDGYQLHHRHPFGCDQVRWNADGGVMHLQFVRQRALRAKQAYYKMMEVLRWPDQGVARIDQKYSWWDRPVAPGGLRELPPECWKPYEHLMKYADFTDGETWWERKIHQWFQEYGRERFAGLNLFGVEALQEV